ncbi:MULTISPECIES: L-alanine exporter AlaE [Microbulbifer]|uniref:L-alanine exporter AlaE n=1 Tax=Microbulbifer TaxID=48073 RepID=UPI001E5A0D55|nr:MULTISPECIES: L-alanine exporter AlaE [Microbulbifer]UHQ54355.1 L-alanine exporter AlaE [Microbulbifer sp. YPW16]
MSTATTITPPEMPAIEAPPGHTLCRRRELVLDIFAMNSFSWAVAIPIELLLAGMSLQEHIQVRLMAVVFNTLIARPFGVYRHWVADRFGGRGPVNAYLLDTFVFLSFQFPLYVGNMLLGGASWAEIATASATFLVIAGALGRPYGIYLDWLRRMWINRRSRGIDATMTLDPQ